jgi:hypothetical protein
MIAVVPVLCVGCLILATVGIALFFGARFRSRLRRHPAFTSTEEPSSPIPPVTYASPDHPLLDQLRRTYRLDEIAGDGRELDQLARLLTWVHGLTTHARNPSWPERMNGLHLVELAREQGKRFNCWMYATVLNDVLLSLGHASRIIHLWPKKERPNESHVVTSVYSREREKWIHLDPDMCAFVTDESAVPLSVMEIRERIIARQPLRVSDSIHIAGAGWIGRPLLKRVYLWYLSKNIFRMDCRQQSEPDYESHASGKVYLHLIPDGYHDEWLSEPRRTERGNTIRYLRDEQVFWAPPPRD